MRTRTGPISWELASLEPSPPLRPYVRDIQGYRERGPAPLRRRELPVPAVVLVIELGPTLRIVDGAGVRQYPGGFVAGPDDTFTLTEHAGAQSGIQVTFTLPGALRFFGAPPGALARRVVGAEDVLGAEFRRLRAQLAETPGWAARLELVERALARRLRAATPPADWLDWAWRRIEESGGAVSIDALASEVGFSRKHLSVRFRERFGFAPKPLARLVRFDRAVRLLRAGGVGLAEVASACGYFDQAHLGHELQRFAGIAPGAVERWPGG